MDGHEGRPESEVAEGGWVFEIGRDVQTHAYDVVNDNASDAPDHGGLCEINFVLIYKDPGEGPNSVAYCYEDVGSVSPVLVARGSRSRQ